MTDDEWDTLVSRIRLGRCTPFLGAGAAVPSLPLGGDIAEQWAEQHGYPLPDTRDLARVAQYLAVHQPDPMRPKELLEEQFGRLAPPDFTDPYEPHGLLADLGLPLYITTNYDDFMLRALKSRNRDARREICRWNDSYTVKQEPSPLLSNRRASLTPANPIVFHLHGHLGVLESLVLTEDDYLDFLVAISRRPKTLLPHQVSAALSTTSLMFVGYALADWDFRVLHRGLVATSNPGLRRFSVAVQLRSTPEAEAYVEKYFQGMNVSVFWGDAMSFCKELRDRWDATAGT